MFISRKRLSRRNFLAGAGVTISLPLLDAMFPALSKAQDNLSASQFRFGGVYFPNGALPRDWQPKEAGRGFTFNRAMQSLEPFRDQLLTVSGLRHSGTPGPHLGAVCGWMNGVGAAAPVGQPIRSEKTLDQYIVDKYAGETPLPSIELGTEDMGTSIGACDGFSCLYFNSMSWRTESQPLPIEINPRLTFERMFGETGTTEQRLARLRHKGSLLDSVTEELSRLNNRLSASDSQRLSSYLDNVREVELRLQRVMNRTVESDADVPAAPSGIPESFEEHMELTYDLMHLAYQGDISRVITFMTGHEASLRGYPHLGISQSHHSCSHHSNNLEEMEKYTSIVTWHTQQFANFVQKLKDTPDGDGSLLDHTLLFYGSGMGNGNVHDRNEPPTLIVGGANGRMAGKGNQHIVADSETPTANFLITLSEIADLDVEQIGPSTGKIAV